MCFYSDIFLPIHSYKYSLENKGAENELDAFAFDFYSMNKICQIVRRQTPANITRYTLEITSRGGWAN